MPFLFALLGACSAQTPAAEATGPEATTQGARRGRAPAAGADKPGRQEEAPPVILGERGEVPLLTLDGRPTELKAYGARVTVIALWAIWCAPCLEELPYLEDLHKRYAEREEVSVLAVNIDGPSQEERVKETVRGLGLSLPVLTAGRLLFEQLAEGGQRGLPLLAIISPEFDVHRITGFQPGVARATYLAEKSAIIEAFLRGEKPPSSATSFPGPPPKGSILSMKIPRIEPSDEDRIESLLRKFRTGFIRNFPELSDEELESLLVEIEAALRRGDSLVEFQP